jgi:DNA polymerase III sliding clamp (beta) subunit (PCNA family)
MRFTQAVQLCDQITRLHAGVVPRYVTVAKDGDDYTVRAAGGGTWVEVRHVPDGAKGTYSLAALAKTAAALGTDAGVEEGELGAQFITPAVELSCRSVNAEEVTGLPEYDYSTTFVVDTDSLAAAVKTVAYAAAKRDTRPVLEALFLEPAGSHLQVTATDSYRLATQNIWVVEQSGTLPEPGANGLAGWAVPRNMFLALTLDESTATLRFHRNSVVRLDCGDVTVIDSLIAGEYPNYRRAIPDDEPAIEAYIDAAQATELCGSLRKITRVAKDRTDDIVTLVCELDRHGQLACSVRDTGDAMITGRAHESLLITAWRREDDSFRFGVNPEYFADLLSHLPGGARISWRDETGPLIADRGNVVGDTEPRPLHLLMPVKL